MGNMTLMAILDELRQAVLKDERSQMAIAREAGIHRTTFSAFMHGRRGLSIETIEQLAKTLRLTLKLAKSR